MGATEWRRDARVVELFCGRGGGLRALHHLGFTQLEGINLSPSLAAHYTGSAKVQIADCRQLPFSAATKDILSYKADYTTWLRFPRIWIKCWPRRGAY